MPVGVGAGVGALCLLRLLRLPPRLLLNPPQYLYSNGLSGALPTEIGTMQVAHDLVSESHQVELRV